MARWALVAAAGLALGTAALAPGLARAQLSDSGGPISYSADNLEYFDGDRRLVLTGDVDLVQGDARLRANTLTLFFAQATPQQQQAAGGLGAGDIQRMVADGNVYYVRPDQSARGNHAVYEKTSDTVTFTGNVVVASTENVIRGETLVLQVGSKQTQIRPGNGQRVRGVFVPQQRSQQSAQCPPGRPAQQCPPAGSAPASSH